MKTTIEIADPLLTAAKDLASREQTTLRALVDEGLRQLLRQRRQKERFELRDASFGGRGLRPGIREGDWETIRRLAYEGRGI